MSESLPSNEPNPFKDSPAVAKKWIEIINAESGLIRDRELYPSLRKWSEGIQGLLVDVGSGDGICADYVQSKGCWYVGVEPGKELTAHANSNREKAARNFIEGDAYSIPLPDGVANAVMSVNVWFHLRDPLAAAKEMARIMERDAKFLISTANPKSYQHWERMFDAGAQITEHVIRGSVNVPGGSMQSIIYKHTFDDLIGALEEAGLTPHLTTSFGDKANNQPDGLFLNIEGVKS